MKLLLALGNHGAKYAKTRHNIGWLFADFLQQKWNFPSFTESKKWRCMVSKGSYQGTAIVLVKPLTYMNKSGEALQLVCSYYAISVKDVIVLHDDKDIPFASVRIKNKGGHGGHNGIRDVLRVMNTNAFSRIKFGVATDALNNMPTDAFVLGRFTNEEQAGLLKIFTEGEQKLLSLLAK